MCEELGLGAGITFKNEEERIDQGVMVEMKMAVCRQVQCWGWRRGRESKLTKFLSLGDFVFCFICFVFFLKIVIKNIINMQYYINFRCAQ